MASVVNLVPAEQARTTQRLSVLLIDVVLLL